MNFTDWFAKWTAYKPDKIAFREYESGRTMTYSSINSLGNSLALWLQEKGGLGFGSRIAVISENCLEYVLLFAAAQKAGYTLVPLNYRLATRELDFMLDNSKPEMIIYEKKYHEKISQAESYQNSRHKIEIDSILSIAKENSETNNKQKQFPEIPEDHPIFIIYTAGTTSFPKGALYTHKMLFWNSINTEMRLDITSSDRALNCAPPFHTGSWNVLQNPFIHHGAYTLLMKSFEPDKVLRALEDDEHTIFWGVPTMLKMMAESPVFHEVSLKKVRYFVVGGEAMPIPLIKIWHDKDIPIRQGYGLTEVGPNVMSLEHTHAFSKAGSIGMPNFYYKTRIVNEKGEDLGPDEQGEFLLKGPAVTPAYWENEEATKNTIIDGWFHTGDIVKKDEEGFIYVVDRLKNMYISGGENVYPAEVEHFLRSHPEINDVAIIGIPDEKWGESGKAYIVKKPDSALKAEEVYDFCLGKLAKYKIPKEYEFIEELPKNHAGKIDRNALRKQNKDNQ